jgi:hypothetical protein
VIGEICISPGEDRQAFTQIPVYIGYCVVFKVREEVSSPLAGPGNQSSEPPAVRRSLKTQQHAWQLFELPLEKSEISPGHSQN